MPIVKYSREARKMLKDRKGFRCELAYDSGVRRPSSVIDYEWNELGNEDEPTLHLMCDAILDEGERCTIENVIDRLRSDYDSRFDAIWLGTRAAVKEFYCDEGDVPVAYKLGPETIVLQDLGYDGTLFLIPKSAQ